MERLVYNRKEGKRKAREQLKRHYVILIFLCIVAAVVGTAYGNSLMLLSDHLEIGNTRGVFALLYNRLGTEFFPAKLCAAVWSRLAEGKGSMILWLILSVVITVLFWMFISNVYKVLYVRIFLETRVYDEVPITRLGFLAVTGRWVKAAMSMTAAAMIYNLWCITIVGGVVKHFSYFAVPYILAEKPDMNPVEAVTLSKRMMDGHKMECFYLQLSIIGWEAINVCTIGLLGIFFLNPYKEALYSDYYVWIRERAGEAGIPGMEELKDLFLYEREPQTVLADFYGEPCLTVEYQLMVRCRQSIGRFLSDMLGVCSSKRVENNFEYDGEVYRESVRNQAAGREYPECMAAVRMRGFRRKRRRGVYAERKYTIWTLMIIFMCMSMLGWCWEVALKMMTTGEFVNKGVLFGPWLPIYGAGAVVILTCLYRMRKSPVGIFVGAMILCGVLEYCTGLILEKASGGQKWWDYSGYFLNLDGRVCAEGLLVFGLGALIIVYVMAPWIDNLLQSVNRKIVITVCLLFFLLFTADAVLFRGQAFTAVQMMAVNPGLKI